MTPDEQKKINFNGPDLPPNDEVSLNVETPRTLHWVKRDFTNSEAFTIITGFSSLEFLLYFFHQEPIDTQRRTRLLLGHEDIRVGQVKRMPKTTLSHEISDYWLERGISIEQCGAVLHLITLIEQGKVEVRILPKLHAKIYVGDTHAMLGSSNFSWNGLQYQKEGNIRVKHTHPRYEQIKKVADYYFEQGHPFNDNLIDLLKQLLQNVTWQEALARSAALLIEGDWWKAYTEMEATLREFNLWPTQEQAIGRALYILDNHGSVLIADPTGSGKTRLGMALHLTLLHRLWASGHARRVNALLLSPPRVMDNWQGEYLQAHSDFSNIVSHGTLSSGSEDSKKEALDRLRDAHILLMDEAHNFINKSTNRSQEIAKSLAEHIVLFTATPINRQKEDLFRMIELLDIDNFPDEIIRTYRQYAYKKRELKGDELARFKQVLHHFVVRRTKKELNEMIWQEPELYRNRLGERCKYPQQFEQTYELGESAGDIALAEEINEIAGELVGVTRLQKLNMGFAHKIGAEEQQNYLELRLKSAAALARYMVQAMLRSSKAALIEHIYGSEEAKALFDLQGLPKNKDSGNVLEGIHKLWGELPKTNLDKIELPLWMRDRSAYQNVCDEEIKRYARIGELAKRLSRSRAKSRMRKIKELLQEHQRVVAFDHRIISLYYLRKLLVEEYEEDKIILVTGGNKKDTLKSKRVFGLASEKRGYLGLFSDAMAEGVNLQGASAMIFLDMPSVVRLAEQRIGRIDRMDSPHTAIEIYWPNDHVAFALKTDRRFFKTTKDVEKLLGSNFRIPDVLKKEDLQQETVIQGQEAIELRKEFEEEKEKQMEELFADAFQSVEDLVLGDDTLIDPALYDKLRTSKARVYANVSVVRSQASWGFFALEGAANNAPRWLFIDEDLEIHTDLPVICQKLRHWLVQSENIDTWDQEVSDHLNQFTNLLHKGQIDQLPLKKQRAIRLLQKLLSDYQKDKSLSSHRKHLLFRLQEKLQPQKDPELSVDYDQFGRELIRYFQPSLQRMRIERSNSRKVILLSDLKKHFRNNPIPNTDLENLLSSIRLVRSANRRVVACIIGIGDGS